MKKIIVVFTFCLLFFCEAIAQNTGRCNVYFHIVDEEATRAFNNLYNANPNAIFNEEGELLPCIIPFDVYILGIFDMDRQKMNDHGNPDFVAIRRGIGLEGRHIRDVQVIQNSFNNSSEIIISLTFLGGEILYNLTSANLMRPMAIVLGNRVRIIAFIQTSIRDSVMISGLSEEEANNMAHLLKAAIPAE